MKTTHRHVPDGWNPTGAKINSPENLVLIQSVLEEAGPIIVERWHHRGARAPDRLVFDDFDEFVDWLETSTAGDSIWVWGYAALCLDDNSITHGKVPNEAGEVPARGAY